MSLQNSFQILPGQILVSSWGYEQTNVDFYKVIKVENGWATIQKMESISQGDPSGFRMTTKEMPGVVIESEKAFRRKIKKYPGSPEYIMINSYSHASAWSGEPQFASHYA